MSKQLMAGLRAAIPASARVLMVLGAAVLSIPAQAAGETPEQCFEQAKALPGDRQEAFLKTCLGPNAAPAKSTVSADQRSKVCDSIAEREGFQGEQKATFLKGCKGS